jgi:hypothetical protein
MTLILEEAGPVMFGIVLTLIDDEPVTIEYTIECDRTWRTSSVEVELTRADRSVSELSDIFANGEGKWFRMSDADGLPMEKHLPRIDGCLDIDLAFSPATNTLPIRRLNLAIDESKEITAAWLQFPSLRLEPLHQCYTRTGESTYRYESLESGFAATLEVDELGLVRNYEGLWERVGEAKHRS